VSGTGSKKRTASPRSKGGGPSRARKPAAPKRAAAFLESLLPDTDEQSGTAYADRKTKQQTAHRMGVAFERATRLFNRIEEELEKDEDTAVRRGWDDRSKRRSSDEKSRVRAENRADVRLMVWVEERRRAMRRQDWLVALATLTTLGAFVLACLALVHNQIGFAGASIFTMLITGGKAFTWRWLRTPTEDSAMVDETAIEPPPFKWSVVDVQPEVEPEQRSPEE
jgi:hypothetical protein